MELDETPWFRRPGLYVSAALHAGVVALTFFSWPVDVEPLKQEEFVPVEMMEIAESTNVKATTKAKEPEKKPEPAKKPDPKPKTTPKVAEAQPEPKPEPEKKPEPKPEPPPEKKPEPEAKPTPPAPKPEPKPPEKKPEPAPTPTPEPQPEKAEVEPAPAPPTPRAKPKEVKEPPKEVAEAEPEPEAEPEAKPDAKPEDEKKPEKKPAKKPAEDVDIDDLVAGLEDKENTDEDVEEGPEETKSADTKTQKGKGDPSKATAAIEDAFKSQIARCWSPPAGAPDAEKLVVLLGISLNRDGSLNGLPVYKEQGKMGDPYYRAAAESARRAVMQCQNYELPADNYETWSQLTLRFDPSEMLGL